MKECLHSFWLTIVEDYSDQQTPTNSVFKITMQPCWHVLISIKQICAVTFAKFQKPGKEGKIDYLINFFWFFLYCIVNVSGIDLFILVWSEDWPWFFDFLDFIIWESVCCTLVLVFMNLWCVVSIRSGHDNMHDTIISISLIHSFCHIDKCLYSPLEKDYCLAWVRGLKLMFNLF